MAWEILRDEFQGTIRVWALRLQTLQRDFENHKMKEGESVKDYSLRVMEVVNQLKAYGDSLTDLRVIGKLLV